MIEYLGPTVVGPFFLFRLYETQQKKEPWMVLLPFMALCYW